MLDWEKSEREIAGTQQHARTSKRAPIRLMNARTFLCNIEMLESRTFCDHAILAMLVKTHSMVVSPGAALVHKSITAGIPLIGARNVGTLSFPETFRDLVSGTRPQNLYEITLTSAEKMGFSLTHITADANLQLFQDVNHDGVAEPSEIIASSVHPGLVNESIGRTLTAGTYYVRVFDGTTGNSIYTLSLSPARVIVPALTGLKIVFDYRYDISGFFVSHPQAEMLLNQAASTFSVFTNKLAAIEPTPGNTWNESFAAPNNTGRFVTISNPVVAANTVVIYVGASSNLTGSELGRAGPGGWSATGSLDWLNTVSARGQAGALQPVPSGFGPWGGEIVFSDTPNWNLTAALPKLLQDDFLSVATHEIAHVLGFGTASSWSSDVANHAFVGAHVVALNHGYNVLLSPDASHWANGTMSTTNGTLQFGAMDPFLRTGTRRAFTLLDYAGMQDVGWTVT